MYFGPSNKGLGEARLGSTFKFYQSKKGKKKKKKKKEKANRFKRIR